MRYAYQDLGRVVQGSQAIVRWKGAGADVMLLDPVNFVKFRDGRAPVTYSAGGHFSRPPARLGIPEEGRWYVVIDLRGYSTGSSATVEVVDPGDPEQSTNEETLATIG